MTTMPDYAIRGTWDGDLPEPEEEALLLVGTGTVLSHHDGLTSVAVPISGLDVEEVAERLGSWATILRRVAGRPLRSLSIDLLEE